MLTVANPQLPGSDAVLLPVIAVLFWAVVVLDSRRLNTQSASASAVQWWHSAVFKRCCLSMLARNLHILQVLRVSRRCQPSKYAPTLGHAAPQPHAAARARNLSTRAAHSHPVVYHPDFQISPIPDDHGFPMPKDHLLYLALQDEDLAQLTFTPTYPDAATLSLVHDERYIGSFLDGSMSQQQMRRIGLPWSQKLVQRTLIGTGSAILAARLALQYGVACMTNGGTHHAHKSHGSGRYIGY